MEKGKGEAILFSLYIEAVGRISSGERGKGTGNSGKKIKILKNGCGEEYKVAGKFLHRRVVTSDVFNVELKFKFLDNVGMLRR